jgi:hypothetical protein
MTIEPAQLAKSLGALDTPRSRRELGEDAAAGAPLGQDPVGCGPDRAHARRPGRRVALGEWLRPGGRGQVRRAECARPGRWWPGGDAGCLCHRRKGLGRQRGGRPAGLCRAGREPACGRGDGAGHGPAGRPVAGSLGVPVADRAGRRCPRRPRRPGGAGGARVAGNNGQVLGVRAGPDGPCGGWRGAAPLGPARPGQGAAARGHPTSRLPCTGGTRRCTRARPYGSCGVARRAERRPSACRRPRHAAGSSTPKPNAGAPTSNHRRPRHQHGPATGWHGEEADGQSLTGPPWGCWVLMAGGRSGVRPVAWE